MGVVNQVCQLLQSANHLTEFINHSHKQTSFPSHCRHDHKLDSIAEISFRQKNLCTMVHQQVSTKAKPCLQYIHSKPLQNRKPWPALENGLLQPVQIEPAGLKHCGVEKMAASNAERQASTCLMKATSAQRIPLTINESFVWHHGSMSSSLAELRARASVLGVPPLVLGRPQGATIFHDPKSLVISTPAPLVPRPHLSNKYLPDVDVRPLAELNYGQAGSVTPTGAARLPGESVPCETREPCHNAVSSETSLAAAPTPLQLPRAEGVTTSFRAAAFEDLGKVNTRRTFCRSNSCSLLSDPTDWVLITLKSEDSMDRNVHQPQDIHYNERAHFFGLLRVAEVGYHQRVAVNSRQHPPTGHVSGSSVRETQITARGPEHEPCSITGAQ
ncbi:hypothetical protein QQF64_009140 [Cirrhinus molitorella]|uniref:Uncharacterized protein n=1 Tax=Cirrhinus molitorella TaxID=172907 RepID=A0ABR3M0B5_9TELE